MNVLGDNTFSVSLKTFILQFFQCFYIIFTLFLQFLHLFKVFVSFSWKCMVLLRFSNDFGYLHGHYSMLDYFRVSPAGARLWARVPSTFPEGTRLSPNPPLIAECTCLRLSPLCLNKVGGLGLSICIQRCFFLDNY